MASPPARFVLMTAEYLNLSFHVHKIDLFKMENKSEFFKSVSKYFFLLIIDAINNIIVNCVLLVIKYVLMIF